MRVVITTDTVGGVWRFTQELVAGLLDAGDAVALISFGPLPGAEQRAECAQLAGEWGESFRYVAADVSLEWMPDNEHCFEAGAAVIHQAAQQFRPDILHANQFCWGALDVGVPKIVTAHSDVLSWARECRGGALEESPWIARYRAMVQRGLDGADGATAPTHWMLRALGEGFKLRREIRMIPNGTDLPLVQTRGARRLQAVSAGRLWDEAKSVALLENVASPLPLVIAGESAGGGASFLCPAGIKLLGSLDHRELLQLFHESAIYVCTSRYEPFGLAPLEAALCGCAVVARKIEPLQEVWGDAAIYFEDADDLSALLTWLYEDQESLRKSQLRAAARAGLYTRNAMVRSYRALYSAVMELASVS